MKNKKLRRFLATFAMVVLVSNVTPVVAFAEETETSESSSSESSSSESSSSESSSSESSSSESSSLESSSSESNSEETMKVTETKNEDGSTTTTYEYKETVKADNLEDAVDKYNEKVEEQDKIKADIEAAGGSYEYTVEIEDNSTTEEVTDRYDTAEEAKEAASKVNGTITEVEGDTKPGQTAQQGGFATEKEAEEWATEKEKELIETQTGDDSEKVTAESIISKVEGTGITTETTKVIEEKTFDTQEEAEEYAQSFEDAEYTITPVNGKWIYEKMEVTLTDKDGNTVYFDNKEAADNYIEENKVEGAFLEKIEVVDSETEEVKETVIITATSYEDFVAKVNALYAEAAANENVEIVESKEDVLKNYETSINFEDLTEEERKELMKQMQEDAKDQNYTYVHLDLQTAAKLNVYDDKGNPTEVDCSIKSDNTLKVKVFTEIDGKMTEIKMETSIGKDPQGYWEIRSKNKKLNLSKCFVLIEGTLEYTLNGEKKTAPFSTTGYLNNDYNTCSQKPGKTYGKKPYYQYESKSGGYDIILDDFTMNSEGKVTVQSTATKVYTITVTKTTTKYVVKYEVDDPSTGVYEEDYKVSGTYVEETEIPAEYMAQITTQLTDILYDVNYTKTNLDFSVIVDGEGNVTVLPITPPEENEDTTDDSDDKSESSGKDNGSSNPTTAATVIAEIPVQPGPEQNPVQNPVQPVVVPTTEDVIIPKTSDVTETSVAIAYGISGLSAMVLGILTFSKKRNKKSNM